MINAISLLHNINDKCYVIVIIMYHRQVFCDILSHFRKSLLQLRDQNYRSCKNSFKKTVVLRMMYEY